ncbi:hypothetical protein M9458_021296, partial [Cirrhinus mrigala]
FWSWEKPLNQEATRNISANLQMWPWTLLQETSMCQTAIAIPGSSNSHQRANISHTGEQ